MKRNYFSLLSVLLFVVISSCKDDKDKINTVTTNNAPKALGYTVINLYPHNPSSFTEGLEWHDGILYESTGMAGQSRLAKVALQTGKDIQTYTLPKEIFGEGITKLHNKIYQITYTTEKGYVFDATSLKKLSEFTYKGEGWGLTNDGKQIIMSNGSNEITYRDTNTFAITKTIQVTDNNGPVGNINELEYVDGFIYANIYTTRRIVKINPATGLVVASADLSTIIDQVAPSTDQTKIDVLNGIAYDSIGHRFFITGKYWPNVFEVKFN